MAETAAKAPARTRRASTTTRKTAAATKPAEAAVEATTVEAKRIPVELEHVGTTKRYEKFGVPADVQTEHEVVGNLYAPLGTTAVKVLVLVGPAE